MNLSHTEEQSAIADLVRSICGDHSTTETVRAMENDPKGYKDELWTVLADSGLLGTMIPEEFGGNPIGMLENVSMYEEFGRSLAPCPHFTTAILAARLLQEVDETEQSALLLSRIARGDIVMAIAWLEPGSSYDPVGVNCQADRVEGGVRLNGLKRHVFFAGSSEKLIVLARTGDDPEDIDLFLVDADAPGLSLDQELSMASDTQYQVVLRDVFVPDSACLTTGGAGWSTWHEVLLEAIILDASRAVGLAQKALDITVEYAKTREQFDKPIAAFQSISHYLADCSTEVEGARLLVAEAAWAYDQGLPHATLAAAAKLFACKVARDVTAKAQQIHGGIGFTMEYDIQLYFRRAKQQQLNWLDSRALEAEIAHSVLDKGCAIAAADPFAA